MKILCLNANALMQWKIEKHIKAFLIKTSYLAYFKKAFCMCISQLYESHSLQDLKYCAGHSTESL